MGIEKINVGEGGEKFYWGGGVSNFQGRLRFFREGLKFFRLGLRYLQKELRIYFFFGEGVKIFRGVGKLSGGAMGVEKFKGGKFKIFRRRVENFPGGGVHIFSGVVGIFLSGRDGFGRGWDYFF